MEATIFKGRRSSSSALAMHKQSYSITKSKPKIRIIHIYAPEIIKTDVANFRELVQSLTGKPENHGVSKTKPRRDHRQVQDMTNMEKLREPECYESYDQGFCLNSEMEEISMTWNGNNGVGESSGGFLNGMGDFEGFIQELGEFPYLPLTSMDVSASSNSSSSSHLHGGSVFSDSHHQFV
ncbi:VQ motif-containing protein 25 [Raphanus sativus]|uniref:VQ motif-containing protein 25 n=1 Tax=Raphanus sativus TaxID=3726 RepID=A0A6J0NZQ5_RAPSA|nr:VQ motif-containing protein 25 [Raphanus sativus]KAJ4896115.1 VQ motif-containing protein 25 [Raphanus sativus]